MLAKYANLPATLYQQMIDITTYLRTYCACLLRRDQHVYDVMVPLRASGLQYCVVNSEFKGLILLALEMLKPYKH